MAQFGLAWAPAPSGARGVTPQMHSNGTLRAFPQRREPKLSRQVQTCYGKGQGLEDRWALSKTIKTMQLEKEEASLLDNTLGDLRRRLEKLGESTLGINNPVQLRKLLAHRLHVAKAKATRFPLRRTSKTGRMSKSYLLVPVDVQDVGISDFLIDTGTTGTLITSEMRDELGLSPVAGNAVRGLDNLGVTLRQKIALPELRLGPFHLDIPDGFVTNVKIAGSDNIGGVLGLRFLSSYDVELDPGPPGHMAFHPLGHVASGVICTDGCAQLTCSTTKGGLVAVQVSLNGCPPFPGIIDLGATYSTMNTAAAKAAEEAGGNLQVGKVMSGDGANMDMVVRNGVSVRLGDPNKGECHKPPHDIMPVLIRDVPILSVLGFQDQPAMVLGKDLVGNGRTVLSLANNTIWLQQ